MDDRRRCRRDLRRVLATSPRSMRLTMAPRPTLGFLDRVRWHRCRRKAFRHARRRFRRWRHAAQDRALGDTARHRRRACRHRPQSEQRGREGAYAGDLHRLAITGDYAGACRAGVGHHHLEPRRASYDARISVAFLRFMERRRARLARQRPASPSLRASQAIRCSRRIMRWSIRSYGATGTLSVASHPFAAASGGRCWPKRCPTPPTPAASSAAFPIGCASSI
jgi:hypothetical protein